MLRHFEIEALELAVDRISVPLKFFLAGPYIDPASADPPPPGDNLTERSARFHVYQLLKQTLQVDCVLGEHETLQKIYADHLDKDGHPTLANVAMMEAMHATDRTDGIIIFPCSPGSFGEFGYFAAIPKVCRKMLVLLDAAYRTPGGYIQIGTALMAQSDGAEIHYVDYKDIARVEEVVRLFVRKIRTKKLSSKYKAKDE
jgi:hypothetical protein